MRTLENIAVLIFRFEQGNLFHYLPLSRQIMSLTTNTNTLAFSLFDPSLILQLHEFSSFISTNNFHSTINHWHRKMVFLDAVARVLSTREYKSIPSTNAPTRSISLAAIFRSKKQLKPSQVAALREALSTSVSDPSLGHILTSLPSNLRRTGSSRSSDLCTTHASLTSGPLLEIKNLLVYELHWRLAHLCEFPRIYLSLETQTYLYQTLRQYRIYFRDEPSRDVDRRADCESVFGMNCLACTLSLFFRDKAAVKALAVCSKSRRQRGAEWPPLLDWLEQGKKEKDWEEQWTRDGENVRRDRRRAKHWRKCGGENGGDVYLVALDKGKSKEKDFNEEKELDEDEEEELNEEAEEAVRMGTWIKEQEERAARFSAERNHAGQEPAYMETDVRPNPFADPKDFCSGGEGKHRPTPFSDENELPPNPFCDGDSHLIHDHGQEQETKQREQKKRPGTRVQAYEALTGFKPSPSVVAQISQDQYQPAEWRRIAKSAR